MKKIVVGITGASGGIYGLRLLQAAIQEPVDLHVILTNGARAVMAHELSLQGDAETLVSEWTRTRHPEASLQIYPEDRIAAPPASGSFPVSGMAVTPCSMNTLAGVASGNAGNLLLRACDVTLKERRPLILMVRETPFSLIHLRNMETACLAGATIMPASPSFYGKSDTVMDLVDSVVARALDHLGIRHALGSRWGME